jgi:hypothetical protein
MAPCRALRHCPLAHRDAPRGHDGPERPLARRGTAFPAGERIHTENSYKYSVERFTALLEAAGFATPTAWTDPNGWFAVFWAPAA